jgi:hypothetical protein
MEFGSLQESRDRGKVGDLMNVINVAKAGSRAIYPGRTRLQIDLPMSKKFTCVDAYVLLLLKSESTKQYPFNFKQKHPLTILV